MPRKRTSKERLDASFRAVMRDLEHVVGKLNDSTSTAGNQRRLHGFNYNVEEWFERDRYETLAICRSLALARAAFKAAVEEKPSGRFMMRSRTRVVKRHPEEDW